MKTPLLAMLLVSSQMSHAHAQTRGTEIDLLVIGSGIMSSTLTALLKRLDPSMSIEVYERLSKIADESTRAENNAGTGHAASCELNFTPESPDGSVDISKALRINEAFEHSLQFWASLVRDGTFANPRDFIRAVPHLSFVQGDDIDFLKARFEAMSRSHLFEGMEYSEDPEFLRQWVPLMMEGRDPSVPVAMTRSSNGTDINFGVVAQQMLADLEQRREVPVFLGHEIRNLAKRDDHWEVTIRDLDTDETFVKRAKKLFVGAGGATLLLLQKTGIPEARAYGGVPISGQFLVSNDPEVARGYHAIVYGKAPVGSPPMSVPHLDVRYIDGKPSLMFGPFAGLTTSFLQNGSLTDWPRSWRPSNLIQMIGVGLRERSLLSYLAGQLLLTKHQRMKSLRQFFPGAQSKKWSLQNAGVRVQNVKNGELLFGTEVLVTSDQSVGSILGASPGASTAVSIMFDVLSQMYPDRMAGWRESIQELVPTYGKDIASDAELARELKARAWQELGLGLDSSQGACEDATRG